MAGEGIPACVFLTGEEWGGGIPACGFLSERTYTRIIFLHGSF